MAEYLVTLSLGPVQSMIGAARRTRDLWCGSWLLSEAARAAARVIHHAAPGGLIFPAPDDPDTDLTPLDYPGDEANIANILRAVIRDSNDEQVAALCASAREAAEARLKSLGDEAKRDLKGLRAEVWQAQIHDLLECFSAWVRVDNDDYAAASKRLGAVLAARKATRDFAPAAIGEAGTGLPKSSLDGAFETVLPKNPAATLIRQLALSQGEQLDALGVIKRAGGDPEQFTAYSRIAADPWLERLTEDQLKRLGEAYEPLVGLGLATCVKGNEGAYERFPYDAQLLFDFRLRNARSSSHWETDAQPALDALRELETRLKAIRRERDLSGARAGLPVPYAAILQADGDHMGELLSRARSAEQSRNISRALHGFACSVRELVRKHRGHAIYSGGDDVLALVPLPNAQACADALAEAFRAAMQAPAEAVGLAQSEWPTLSVGLGIGHIMEPLGSLRHRARQAEKHAKGDTLPKKEQRNALTISLGIRSGGEIQWRVNWWDKAALQELEDFTAAYRSKKLPSRVAYDLRAIDRRLVGANQDADPVAQGMRRAEVARMLDRARLQGGGERLDPEYQKRILRRAGEVGLAQLADSLIIARWLGARTRDELERD